MKHKTRILIVDDHALVRFSLKQAIQGQADLVLAAEAANGVEALERYRKHLPDVVTMDYQLPGENGIEITHKLRTEFPDARILLLSIYDGSEDVWRAMQAGASGYVSKSVEIEEILRAIRCVSHGESYFSEGLAEKLASRNPKDTLTPRELDILREIALGNPNKLIVDKLKIAPSTVKRHIEGIFAKLHVYDRTQAASVALQRGIIHLDAHQNPSGDYKIRKA